LVALLSGCASAQATPKPLSKEDVLNFLKGDVSPKRVSEMVRQRGIDFQVTPTVEQAVRHAGGDDALIAVLREVTPKTAARETAPGFNKGSAATAAPGSGKGPDSPLPLQLGATSKAILSRDERTYFAISLPAGDFRAVMDSRRSDGAWGNLMSNLSVLHRDGHTLKANAIFINRTEVEFRGSYAFSLKAPQTLGFRVANDHDRASFWLTVQKRSSVAEIPFFGDLTPTPMAPGTSSSGKLEKNEYAYYSIGLSKGDWKATLDFNSARGNQTNLIGMLTLFDDEGDFLGDLIHVNSVDVSCRQVATFTLKRDLTVVLRVYNQGGGFNENYDVNYALKLAPASSN
jgi:hypothetical protein